MSSEGVQGIPNAMQWNIKRLKVLQKETISMTPNKTQDVKPGQTIIVDLPYNSKVDLSSFTWFYQGQTTHNGSTAVNGPAGYASAFDWLYQKGFAYFNPYWGSLFFAISFMLLCWLLGYVLDKFKIYIRI